MGCGQCHSSDLWLSPVTLQLFCFMHFPTCIFYSFRKFFIYSSGNFLDSSPEALPSAPVLDIGTTDPYMRLSLCPNLQTKHFQKLVKEVQVTKLSAWQLFCFIQPEKWSTVTPATSIPLCGVWCVVCGVWHVENHDAQTEGTAASSGRRTTARPEITDWLPAPTGWHPAVTWGTCDTPHGREHPRRTVLRYRTKSTTSATLSKFECPGSVNTDAGAWTQDAGCTRPERAARVTEGSRDTWGASHQR